MFGTLQTCPANRGGSIDKAEGRTIYSQGIPVASGRKGGSGCPTTARGAVQSELWGCVMKKRLDKKTLQKEALFWASRKNALTREEVKSCLK